MSGVLERIAAIEAEVWLSNLTHFRYLVTIWIRFSPLQMARTQRNKATAQHLGLLKARLAKLRREVLTPKSGGGGPGEGFDVAKTGDARIGFVGNISILMHDSFFSWKGCNFHVYCPPGFPSVGKSTLLTTLAGVYSEVAAYEFTTLTTVPGCIRYKGAKIQVLNALIAKRLFICYRFLSCLN